MNAWLRVIAVFFLIAATIRAEPTTDVSFGAPLQFTAESQGDEKGGEGPLVGQLGDPESIQFVGLQRLTAKELQSELSTDLDYQAAARPSSALANLLSVLEARLIAGLRHSGFMNATVTATYNGEKNAILVSISEGALFKNGPIQFEGAQRIDGNLISQQLALPGKTQPWVYFFSDNKCFSECDTGKVADDCIGETVWKKEEATDSDEITIERLTMRIRQLMIEQGYPFAVFTVAIEPEAADTAALVIRIASEGSPGVLGGFKMTGLTRHSEEQLLNYLGLKRGSSVSAQVLNDVHTKLRESCRFWGHRLWLRVPDVSSNRYSESPKGLELAITLTEYEHVPPLGEALSAEEESMIRFAHWLERHGVERFSESGDLVIQSSPPSAAADTNFRCVISPRQGMLLDADGEIGDLYAIHHAVIAVPGRAELFNWSRERKLIVDSACINTAINVEWTPGSVENGEYRSRMALGSAILSQSENSDKSRAWNISCDPVAAVHLLYREDAKYERADGELHVRSADTELCIEEATGRLKHMSLKGLDGQNLSAKASFESGAFEQAAQDIRNRSQTYTECFDSDEPLLSAVKFAIDEMIEQPFVRQSQFRQVILSSLQKDLDRIWLEKLASTVPVNKEDNSSTEFEIPAIETNLGDGKRIEFLADVMGIIPAMADQLFPRGSWPWTYTREAVFYYGGSKPRSSWDTKSEILWEGAQSEVHRVFESTDPGLLASLVPLLFFQEYLPGEAIEILVQRGRQSLNAESFTSDIRLLAHNEPISGPILGSFVLQTEGLSDGEREIMRGELPPMAATLIDRLVDRRHSHADESATESLEAIVQETWSAGLSDSLAEFLDSFGNGNRIPKR